MIDEQLIESAKTIRREYLRLSSVLLGYQDEVRELAGFLFGKVDELKSFNEERVKKAKTKDDLKKVTDHIIHEIDLIEAEERKLQAKVERINEEMERLRKEEEVLYATIRERHPKLTDEQIVTEVRSHLPR